MIPFQTMVMAPFGKIPSVLRKGEIFFSLALISILVILILPLHKTLLDAALASSLAFSVMVLMTVLFLETPLDFSVFPTVLLVSTMLRLALNVASTRLILSDGHMGVFAAGDVIKAFGSFVMSGNFLIGLIVFGILVIINFVVITKGSGRIAEVVARFSLDALPGKQMAVDADLSSGLIDQKEAKQRRAVIQEEVNFYGAMDGAAKFVRGDAIAGLFITCINLVGGMIVGVFQKGMTLAEASSTYTLLTVGDGLVAQVPALIVSVAAGMLISKTSSKGTADQALLGQFSAYPVALFMSAFFMGVFALLPGLPVLPFSLLAMGCAMVAFYAQRKEKPKSDGTQATTKPAEEAKEEEKTPQEMLVMDEIKLELGVGLVGLIKDPTLLLGRVKKAREALAQDFGLIIPTVRIVDNLMLETYTYQLKVKEIKAATGRILPGKVIAFDPEGKRPPLVGEEGKEPVLGLKGTWIAEADKQNAKKKGYVVADGKALLVTHMIEVIKGYLPDLLSYSVHQQLIDGLPKAHQKLYADMVPVQISASVVQRVLKNLLAERVSIRDFSTIIEAISEAVSSSKDAGVITERLRQFLSRQISANYITREGRLPVVALSARWSQEFQNALSDDKGIVRFAMPPSRMKMFWEDIAKTLDLHEVKAHGPKVPLLTSGVLRPYVRDVVHKVRPDLAVLSDLEAAPHYPIVVAAEV